MLLSRLFHPHSIQNIIYQCCCVPTKYLFVNYFKVRQLEGSYTSSSDFSLYVKVGLASETFETRTTS